MSYARNIGHYRISTRVGNDRTWSRVTKLLAAKPAPPLSARDPASEELPRSSSCGFQVLYRETSTDFAGGYVLQIGARERT